MFIDDKSEIQRLRDIETITQLSEACPAMRRYFSHHLRNDVMMLIHAQQVGDWLIVGQYIDLLKNRLEMVKL